MAQVFLYGILPMLKIKNINVFKKQVICGLIGEYIDQPFTIATGGKTKSNHQIKFLKITYKQFEILRAL